MKIRMITIILAFATFSWAQTAVSPKANPAQPPASTAPATTKADCPCCQKMVDGKTTTSCCAHHQDGSAKAETSCCKGKDATDGMSCMKGDNDKSADACCATGKCGDNEKQGCCSKADKTTEQAALACCGTKGERCGTAHHDHADINK